MPKPNESRPEEKNPEAPSTPVQPVDTAAPATPAEPAMSEAQMMAMMDKYMAKLSKGKSSESGLSEEQLIRIMRAVRQDQVEENGNINPAYVDPKDQIPEFTFFAPYSYYFLRTKEVAGLPVGLPYKMKKLTFEKDFPKTVITGGVARRRYTCKLRSTNHEVYKWATGKDINGNVVGNPDPNFGVFYFMDPKEMVLDGFDIWEKLFANHKAGLDQMSHQELLAIAKAECGIPPSSDYDKGVLASRIAKKRADAQHNQAKSMVYAEREAAASLSVAMFGQEQQPVQI